jgi:DNA ligase-1
MSSVTSIIEQLRSTNSRNDKIDILTSHIDNELLQRVLVLALDPTIQFYQRKIPSYIKSIDLIPLEQGLDSLSKLSSRDLTGNLAIEHLQAILSELSTEDAKIIELIIQKDLKCGVNSSTVNKVFKDLIPEYPYQRCSSLAGTKFDKWNLKQGVFSQLKADSLYCNLNHDAIGDVKMLSRNGNEFPLDKFNNIVNQTRLHLQTNTQTQGELMVKRDGIILPRELSNGILNSVSKGGEFEFGDEPYFVVWDQIPLDQLSSKCSIKIPYRERFDTLSNQVKSTDGCIELIETRMVHSIDEMIQHFEHNLQLGLEGSVVKHPDSFWEDKTSKGQVKLKLEVDSIELEIIGFKDGKGKNEKTFGSIICQSKDGLLKVNISGMKDAQRLKFHKSREESIGKIISVKANMITSPNKSNPFYSLFLPRFEEERFDKNVADTFEEIELKFESAVKDIKEKLLAQFKE